MNSSQLRQMARSSLAQKWGRAALLTFIYVVAIFAISFVLEFLGIVGSIIDLIITPAISFGMTATFIKLSRNEETKYFSFLTEGFKLLGKIWGVALQTFLKLLLPTILVIVLTIVSGALSVMDNAVLSLIVGVAHLASIIYLIPKSLLYVLTTYILYDEPTLSSKEIVEKSAILMNGNRKRYFFLSLSFIGWSILAAFTIGIGYLWLIPYIEIACIKLYDELSGKANSEPVSDL